MTELLEHKRKRLRMRSMRRGIKEMDMILIRFSDLFLDEMSDAELDHYDLFLLENDQDLYQWCSGQANADPSFQYLVQKIRDMIKTENGLAPV